MNRLPSNFYLEGIEYYVNDWGGVSQYKPEPIEYDENYLDHYRNFDTSGTNKLNNLKLEFILKNATSFVDTILDFGYGSGTFLDRCAQSGKAFGYDVTGAIKPEEVDWEIVENPFTTPVDCVTMWDVLEHLPDVSIIKDFQTKFLAISVPNCIPENFMDLEYWRHLKPNEHLHHFDIDSLKKCLEENGYKYLAHDYGQDEIRKPGEDSFNPNILQALFIKV